MSNLEDINVQPFTVDTPVAPAIRAGFQPHRHVQATLEHLRADPTKLDQFIEDMEREMSRRQLLAAGQANRPD